MVIVMTKSNPAKDILGPLNYLVWSDIFGLCQFVVLVMALMGSVYIHMLGRRQP